jgi:hypothetical protein
MLKKGLEVKTPVVTESGREAEHSLGLSPGGVAPGGGLSPWVAMVLRGSPGLPMIWVI